MIELNFQYNLKFLRKNKGLTQNELAKILNVHRVVRYQKKQNLLQNYGGDMLWVCQTT